MGWATNMKLRAKIGLGFGGVLAIAAILGVVGYVSLAKSGWISGQIIEVQMPGLRSLLEIKLAAEQIKSSVAVLTDQDLGMTDRAAHYDRIRRTRAGCNLSLDTYDQLPKTDADSQAWKELKTAWVAHQADNDEFLRLSQDWDTLGLGNPSKLKQTLQRFITDHLETEVIVMEEIDDAAVYGETESHSECAFGRWIQTVDLPNADLKKAMAAAVEPHQRFHEAVRGIRDRLNQNDVAGAKALRVAELEPAELGMAELFHELDWLAEKALALAVKLHAVLVAGGGSGEADRFADSWIKEHAKDLQFRLYLAEAATARKDYATASKHYRVLVDAQPNNPATLNNLAWALAQNKDPKAIEFAEKANKLAPDQPALMDTLGVLLVDKGDTARGLELLQKAVSRAPQSALIRFNLAKALVKAGKKEEAKRELDELAKLGDKFPAQTEVAKLLQGL